MDEDAYCGLVGEIVETIEPETEADPALILIGTLLAFGNWIGRKPYYQVESTRHYTNEFALFVGQSSKGRKGTGWDRIRALYIAAADCGNRNDIWSSRIKGGLSSGEGIIGQFTDADADKRLMCVEPEFARTLAACERNGSTLSAIIRDAWDQGRLATLTRQPLEVDDAHVSIIGHITDTELRKRLSNTDAANGFANRFLFVHVERSQLLAHGGDDIDFKPLAQRLWTARTKAQGINRMTWTAKAAKQWEDAYAELSRDRGNIIGGVSNRAEAHVIRLAMIYALMDCKDQIFTRHLDAALEVWRYCEDSARHIFQSMTGDSTADKILAALKQDEPTKLSEINRLLSNHKSSAEVENALALLLKNKLVERTFVGNGKGRPAELWFRT